MAARGEIAPMPSAAIFADTQAEPQSVYDWLDWLEKQLPFPVYRVTAGNLTAASLSTKTNRKTGREYYSNLIPAYILNQDGSRGIIGRHCTYNYKIVPIQKKARALGGVKRGQKTIGVIQWIGISLDEAHRMKPCREAWCQHRWPLIEKEMTRHDCLRWLDKNKFPKPTRSACTYCPFHSDNEWRRLKTDDPKAFSDAEQFEASLQKLHSRINIKGRITGIPFLHNSLIPIGEIDFSEDETQGNLNFGNECEGMCGT